MSNIIFNIKNVLRPICVIPMRFLQNILPLKLLWQLGKFHEKQYWDKYIKNYKRKPFDQMKLKLDPDLELQEYVYKCLPNNLTDNISILDVGAGPLTILGKKYQGKSIGLRAVDPLASDYNRIFEKYAIDRPVITEYCEAEQLLSKFKKNQFEIVHARNSLDHGYEPMESIKQMVEIVKPGHYVIIKNYINEAEHACYQGMHQWNFSIQNNRYMVWNSLAKYDVQEELKNIADVTFSIVLEHKRETIIAYIQKHQLVR